MRLLAAALLCLLVSGVAVAATQTPNKVPAKPVSADGLRGPMGALPEPAPISLIKPVSLPPERGAGLTPHDPLDRAECRRACAHAYYFCLQSDDAGDCPQNWTSCLADCSSPSRPLPSRTE
jgi:hypothetical protein